jgi:hypothetical protein
MDKKREIWVVRHYLIYPCDNGGYHLKKSSSVHPTFDQFLGHHSSKLFARGFLKNTLENP